MFNGKKLRNSEEIRLLVWNSGAFRARIKSGHQLREA